MNSIRKLVAAGVASASVALFASASHAAITEYFNEAAFLAAAGPVTTEDFADSTLNADLSITSANGSAGGGVWNDLVVPNGNSATYGFTHSITAFGGFWDENPGGFGSGLVFTLNFSGGGSAQTPTELDNYAGFYGVISTQSFDSVVVSSGLTLCCQETYSADNLHYSGGVPEPGVWALMLMGFGGLGAALRHRKAAVAA